jgi:hypothetical protein
MIGDHLVYDERRRWITFHYQYSKFDWHIQACCIQNHSPESYPHGEFLRKFWRM